MLIKRPLFFGLLIAGSGIATAAASATAVTSTPKLNVLFIAIDDLRPELGCYGTPVVKSTQIDKLSKSSVQFDRAYCQLALCNPSRSSLLTGLRPETLGIYDLKTFVRKSDSDVVTLPEYFKDNGYRALSYGKIFHTGNGNHEDPKSWSEPAWKMPADDSTTSLKKSKKGVAKVTSKAKFNPDNEDPHSKENPYGWPDVADDGLLDGQIAVRTIQALQENKDKPFFIGAGFHKPHMPFVAPKKYWDMYKPSDIALATYQQLPKGTPDFVSNNASEVRRYDGVPKSGPIPDDMQRNLKHGYLACVSYTDAQVGLILNELDRLGLRDKTIVILWGDHGYQLGEHGTWNKRTNWEIATRVPLMISVPGSSKQGQKSDALVELVDLYPTLAELCHLPAPKKIDGSSLVPQLNDPKLPGDDAAFSIYEKQIPGMGSGFGRAMRTARYRFIEWSVPGNPKRIYELYDEEKDPQETVNLADDPQHKDIVENLKKQLAAERPETPRRL